MPHTRSQAKALTPEEVEIYNQRLEEREKRLQEQANALAVRQAEMEQTGSNNMDQILQKLSFLDSLSAQMERLDRRMNDMQDASSQIMAPPPTLASSQAQPRMEPQIESSPIRLKDAIDTIPKYDGHKMSVFQFSKICERALQLIPQYHEYHLVQLIINKLQGHAYSAVEGVEFHSVLELTRRLKETFGPNKNTDQYRGEFANIYMKPGEDILDYVARVREYHSIIIDCETDRTGYINPDTRDQIDSSAMTNFVNGLPPDLLIRVKLERCFTFEESIITAIQLSKQIEAENARKRAANPNRAPRADFPYNSHSMPNNFSNNYRKQSDQQPPPTLQRNPNRPFIKPLIPGQPGPNFPTKVCFYCKTPGHFMKDCRRYAYNLRMEQNQRSAPIPQDQGNSHSVPATDARRSEMIQGRQNPSTPSTTRVNTIMIQKPSTSQETTQPIRELPR